MKIAFRSATPTLQERPPDFRKPIPVPRTQLDIVFLVPEDRRTGTFFRYHNLAIALQKIGHRVTIYSQSSNNRLHHTRETRDGVPYIFSATFPGNRWILPPTNPGTFLRRLLLPVKEADVYHLFQPFPSSAILWRSLRKRRKALFVYDWDDFWINDEFGLKTPRGLASRWAAFWIGQMEKQLPGLADLTTTVSHPLAELAKKRNSARNVVLHNGIWPVVRKEKLAARKRLHLQPDAFYVGLSGWSGEVEWCLEAIRKFKSEFPSLRLAITGLDRSKKLAAYRDIRDQVDDLGALSDEDFSYFNSCLDLGLVPMRESEFNHYRLPYKLTDHLANGVPVLCSRIGEVDRLADDLDGLFTCAPTLESWLSRFGETVRQLLSGEEENRPSPQNLLKRFSWTTIAHKMSSAYFEGLDAIGLQPTSHTKSQNLSSQPK